MTVPSLLPPNRTAWELALSETSGERRHLPTHLIKAVWNPDTCPVDLLGWLAHQLSVDIWDESWPETEKRQVCRNALKLHRLKTTPAGIKEHVALTGATVKRIIRPPAQGFLRGVMTDEQRKAWLDSLPQVRIYPFYRRSVAESRLFMTGPGARDQFSSGAGVIGRRFLRKSRGRQLFGKRATLWDHGFEQEVIYEADEGRAVERVYIGSTRRRTWHGNGFSGHGWLTTSIGGQHVVTVRLGAQFGMFAIGRGVETVDVRPQRVAQPRTAPAVRSFFGRHRAGRFLRASFAPLMIFDKISLHDSERLGARRKTRSYHGHGRFGIESFTAEARIRVPMIRHSRRSGLWHGAGFRQAADMTPLWKAIEAVRVSKAFRDTVLIDTATYGQVRFTGGLRFGEFTFGEIKEVA